MMELETEDSVFTCTAAPRGKEGYPVRLVHVKPHLPHIIAVQLKTELHEGLYDWQELVQQRCTKDRKDGSDDDEVLLCTLA